MTRPDLTPTEADAPNANPPVVFAKGLIPILREQIAAVEVACVMPQQTISAFCKAMFTKISWPALCDKRMSCDGQEDSIARKFTASFLGKLQIIEHRVSLKKFVSETSVLWDYGNEDSVAITCA